MKRLIIFSLIILTYISCKRKIVSDSYLPLYSSAQITQKIDKYYRLNSIDSLKSFLEEWHRTIKPASIEYVKQNDTIENIYGLFIDLYKPFLFGPIEATNYFENKNEYIIIQNTINYDVVPLRRFKSLRKLANSDSQREDYAFYKTKRLLNFRPKLNINSVKYLYLTEEYGIGIENYLGESNYPLGTGNIMNTASPKGESFNKSKFICPILPIVHGHWGGYWHIETFPIIGKIIFDNKFRYALVEFRTSIGYTICGYPLIKEKGHWKPDKFTELRGIQE